LVFLDDGFVLPALFAKKALTGSCASTLGYTRLGCVGIFNTVEISNNTVCTWSTKPISKNEREFTPAIFASGIVGRKRKGHY